MREELAPIKCIVREKNANVDVEMIRQGRAITYCVKPRKVLTTRSDALKWKDPVTDVEQLIHTALERNGPRLHAEYQHRSSFPGSSSGPLPRSTSSPRAPLLPTHRTNTAGRTKEKSTRETRSIGTQTSLHDVTSAGADKPPSPAHRTESSLSNHSVTYTPRSASCQPTTLYQSEDSRNPAKINRFPSRVPHSGEERARGRSAGRTKSPVRIDGTPVELPGFMKTNYFLHHEDLDMGQKQYIWGVARIYSVTQLMSLKQRQYQNLLDYEFSRRIQNKELKEHERVKEWKDYQRYCKFIKSYDQRIPRSKSKHVRTPCEEASHVHRHMIKGWTTDPNANEAYRPSKKIESTGIRKGPSSPEYHPEREQDAGEKESAGSESEEYRLRLIVLPGGKKEDTGTDGRTDVVDNNVQGVNDKIKDSFDEKGAVRKHAEKPTSEEGNYL